MRKLRIVKRESVFRIKLYASIHFNSSNALISLYRNVSSAKWFNDELLILTYRSHCYLLFIFTEDVLKTNFAEKNNYHKVFLSDILLAFYGCNDDCDCYSWVRDAWWELIDNKVSSFIRKCLRNFKNSYNYQCSVIVGSSSLTAYEIIGKT